MNVNLWVDLQERLEALDPGFTPENVANKDTDGTLAANSDVKYPSQKAAKTYVDAKFAAAQPVDSDLTSIAAIAPANDDIIQRKSGGWINRTMAQLKTDLVLVKGDVALGSVDNTSDVGKPVSTAQQTALDLKANLASPTLTGTPTLPTGTIATTQAAGDSSTKVATTAFVTKGIKIYVALLTQSGTNDPTAIVLENTLSGTLVWTRSATGEYRGDLTSAFPADKTWCVVNSMINQKLGDGARIRWVSANRVIVETFASGGPADDMLLNTSVEIRVYP